MLKLKLQYFGHLMRRTGLLEKTLILGNTGSGRRGLQRLRQLYGITDSMDMSLSKPWEFVMDREACLLWFMASQRVTHDRTTELNWGLYVHVQNSYRGMQKVRADTSTKAQMFHFIERLSYLCLWDFIKISQHSLEKKKFIGGLFQLSYKKCLKMNKLKSGYLLVCQQQGGLGDFSCSSAPKNPRERRGSSYWKRKC